MTWTTWLALSWRSWVRCDRVFVPLRYQVAPASVADLPRRRNPFCPSMFTLQPMTCQSVLRLLGNTAWFSIHWAWLKSDCVVVQFWWRALNQTAHSHEFSPVSSLGSQEAQM